MKVTKGFAEPFSGTDAESEMERSIAGSELRGKLRGPLTMPVGFPKDDLRATLFTLCGSSGKKTRILSIDAGLGALLLNADTK
eukprot:CAMPEP_0170569608 /NCGR_PEP_ID=MMETSP0224-20130122/648_1 /TAXON_ID=285029 /ORGANISM="Togula jolla, Strain CCCM 725" /LENGTH=82 /DNA_ID=CAMNT_0010891791 /DNA_START=474 /DNA_END=722 /DNA_ORIENTATION=+